LNDLYCRGPRKHHNYWLLTTYISMGTIKWALGRGIDN
jgi:hypothetical protein